MSCAVICRPPRDAGEQRRDETEGSRQRGVGCGHDLMQRAAAQAAVRQMAIERGKAERLDFTQTFAGGEKTPQFVHHGGAAMRLCAFRIS